MSQRHLVFVKMRKAASSSRYRSEVQTRCCTNLSIDDDEDRAQKVDIGGTIHHRWNPIQQSN